MVSVIIAAAGSGSRMNSDVKKQFMLLLDKPVLIRTLEKFDLDSINEIVIVTNEDDIEAVKRLVRQFNVKKVSSVVAGGVNRQNSIYNGLKAVKGDVVLIHDAARPFVTESIITTNIEAVKKGVGVVTAVPCKDTIKVVKEDVVCNTLNRSELVNVQTPQSFMTKEIVEAYNYTIKKNLSVTDDASAFELFGMTVKTVMGSYQNIKLTTPEDIWVGEAIIKRG